MFGEPVTEPDRQLMSYIIEEAQKLPLRPSLPRRAWRRTARLRARAARALTSDFALGLMYPMLFIGYIPLILVQLPRVRDALGLSSLTGAAAASLTIAVALAVLRIVWDGGRRARAAKRVTDRQELIDLLPPDDIARRPLEALQRRDVQRWSELELRLPRTAPIVATSTIALALAGLALQRFTGGVGLRYWIVYGPLFGAYLVVIVRVFQRVERAWAQRAEDERGEDSS